MAVADPFDSPDSVQLKGKLSGLTRVSRKVKALAAIILMAVVGYVLFAIFGADDDGSGAVAKDGGADVAARQADTGTAPASPNFGNVGSGQAVVLAQEASAAAATSALGPTFAVGASGVGAPVLAAPSPAVPAIGAAGAGKVSLGSRGAAGAEPQPQYQTPEQQEADRHRRDQDEKRNQAINSALDAGGGDGGMGALGGMGAAAGGLAASGSSNPLLAQLAQAAKAATAAQGAGGAAGSPLIPAIGGLPQDDQNKQVRKEQFLASGDSLTRTRLNEVKMPAATPFEIKAGWVIPAALECGLNSDLPGQTCARVIENVYDTATGKYLLIPQGSKLIGAYDSQISYGQERILVVWTRLIFPDGSSISLDGMPGEDKAGNAGFDADVNNHYLKVLGSATFMALFSAGIQLTQKTTVNPDGVPTNSQVLSQSVGQQLGQTGAAYIQKGMNIQPTLTRSPGYKFNIVATRDIVFPSAYRPQPLTANGD
ncbi:TrbI/VirB10 family protein [Paraburkholderia humisilvae]|uniref:Type IV secretion system protein virB10 n=1 Tax=Paraburkholderia humisilvae TaxID=627669 RepID=A0A6J5DNE1_9BURK|nr:TrbI/VirB10 family protein [Paraburkholderia humisilvae]CAB3755820.1 hypothetical protein LMG29542_02704 [Paraburkholderia humisilvae]